MKTFPHAMQIRDEPDISAPYEMIVTASPHTFSHMCISQSYTSQVTVSYGEIKQKVITQANDYHRVKAYTP